MKNYAKINTVLLIILLIISCTICFLLLRNLRISDNVTAGAVGEWTAKKQLEFAETLAGKGLKKEALDAFDDYLKTAKISAMESAKLLYKMGNMYMDLSDYKRALYYFYKAEAQDPSAGFKNQMDEKLVECLKNLDMNTQAHYEMAQRESLGLGQETKDTAGPRVVVAKVGDEEITENEIDNAINQIPDWARENFSQGQGKVEFVRQYVTTQALYEKAKNMGLENDAEIRRNIKDVTKKLLVQRFLEKELKEKVSISPAEVEVYYQANKDKFKEESSVKISLIKISSPEKAHDILRRLEVGADFAKTAQEFSEDENTKSKGGIIEQDIYKTNAIPGIDLSKEDLDAIFSKKEGEIAGPVKIKEAYYIFKINSINPEKEKPFSDIKELVEYEYKNKKVQDQMQALLKDVLQEQHVEVYTDKILNQKPILPEKKEEPDKQN